MGNLSGQECDSRARWCLGNGSSNDTVDRLLLLAAVFLILVSVLATRGVVCDGA